MDEEIDIREYIAVLRDNWKLIVIISLIAGISAFLCSIVQKPVFEAKTTILLRTANSSAMSQFAGLAGALGVNPGGANNTMGDLMELLKSRAVGAKVLNDLQLTKRIKGWDGPKNKIDDLAASVSGMLLPAKTFGNVMEIKVESGDPQLAADVANSFVSALSYYWNEMNYSDTQRKMKYIENELPRVEKDLYQVESKLKLFPRSSSGYSFNGQGNVQRDFEIYNSVYGMLRREYESAKLEATKDTPVFSVIDQALKPKTPTRPKVKNNAMIGAFLGIFLGIFIAFLKKYWENLGVSSK